MAPFPESASPALWLGLGLALVIGLVVVIRLVADVWAKSGRRGGRD